MGFDEDLDDEMLFYNSPYFGPSGSKGQSILKSSLVTGSSSTGGIRNISSLPHHSRHLESLCLETSSPEISPLPARKFLGTSALINPKMDYYSYRAAHAPLYNDDIYTSRGRASALATSTLDDNDLISRRSRLNDARVLNNISMTVPDDEDDECALPKGYDSYFSASRTQRERDEGILAKGRALLSESIASPRFKRRTITRDLFSNENIKTRSYSTPLTRRPQALEYTPRPAYSYQERSSPMPHDPPCTTVTPYRGDDVLISTSVPYLDNDDEVFVEAPTRSTMHANDDNECPLCENHGLIEEGICHGRYSDRHVDDPRDIEVGDLHSRATEISRRYRNREGLYGDVDYSTNYYPRHKSQSTFGRYADFDDGYIPSERHLQSLSDIERKYSHASDKSVWETNINILQRARELENDEPVSVMDRIKVKAKLIEKTLPPTPRNRNKYRFNLADSTVTKFPPEFQCPHVEHHTSHESCLRHVEWHDGRETGPQEFHDEPVVVSIKQAYVAAEENKQNKDPDVYVYKPDSRRESKNESVPEQPKLKEPESAPEVVADKNGTSAVETEISFSLEPAWQTENQVKEEGEVKDEKEIDEVKVKDEKKKSEKRKSSLKKTPSTKTLQ